MATFSHIPVLAQEVMAFLQPHSGGVYLDATLGGGGHSRLILEASSPDGRLIGFDQDKEAIDAASRELESFGARFTAVNANFTEAAETLTNMGIPQVDGFLFDLGVSSHQFDTADRGFSFQYDAPLDMRMDQTSGQTAADLVNSLSHGELARIIRDYGEERWAGRIASFICEGRKTKPIETTFDLVALIKAAIPAKAREERIHFATRTFQGLRIVVNDELSVARKAVADMLAMLKPGGVGLVISFHSLEDRIIKQMFREAARLCTCPPSLPVCCCNRKATFQVLNQRPVTAGDIELAANPRARSAKLRAIKRLQGV